MTFGEAGPVPAQGKIAQQIFWYTAFTADMIKPGLPVVNADGTPKWRMAPVPARRLLEGGHEARLPGRRLLDASASRRRPTARKAAWLYAQFVTSKTVVAEEEPCRPDLHPRQRHPATSSFTERAPKYGGLIEFYRCRRASQWTPTGTNVPDYPKLAQLWWQNVGDAVVRREDAAGRRWTRWPRRRTR